MDRLYCEFILKTKEDTKLLSKKIKQMEQEKDDLVKNNEYLKNIIGFKKLSKKFNKYLLISESILFLSSFTMPIISILEKVLIVIIPTIFNISLIQMILSDSKKYRDNYEKANPNKICNDDNKALTFIEQNCKKIELLAKQIAVDTSTLVDYQQIIDLVYSSEEMEDKIFCNPYYREYITKKQVVLLVKSNFQNDHLLKESLKKSVDHIHFENFIDKPIKLELKKL